MFVVDPDAQIEAEIAAAEARGDDPYADKSADQGSKSDDVQTATAVHDDPAAAVVDAPAQADASNDGEDVDAEATEAPAKKPTAEVASAEPVSDVVQQPAQFAARIPDDYQAKRHALMTQKAQAMAKLLAGEMEADAYAAIDVEVSAGLEDLAAERIRAETLIEANAQSQQQHQQIELKKLVARTKSEVDYAADAKARKQFDTALTVISSDDDNAGMSFAEMIDAAHRSVASVRNVTVKSQADKDATAKPAPERTPPKPPVTLAGLPSAATPGSKSASQVLASLSGDDFERAYDALSAEERARLLR